jgi:NADH dehydrogenase FAD-containing subunit
VWSLAGQIREMATRALANEFHSIEPQDARVLLFDGGSCVLGSFAPALTDKATKILQNLGVELHMGVHVTDVRHDGVTVTPKAGGAPEEFAARTVLWTAGVEAVPFARTEVVQSPNGTVTAARAPFDELKDHGINDPDKCATDSGRCIQAY